MTGLSRPVLRYHGGKWKLAPWIISHFPPHRTYVEPLGGGGSVLMRKPRTYGEVYNDLDGEAVNVFRVLQDPEKAEELRRRLELTPFARDEFRSAYEPAKDDVDAAAKMIARAFMGFGSASMTRMHVTGFRSNASRCGTTPAQDWTNWPYQVPAFCARLRGVVIENRDAIAVMTQHDSPATLHYVDPPYVQSSRSSLSHKNGNRGHYYRHDMEDVDHERLAEFLQTVDGMVVLSGYRTELYQRLFADWTALEREHMADGARRRVETLWLNPRCAAAQRQVPMSLEVSA
jgi:DNA adenine methylase